MWLFMELVILKQQPLPLDFYFMYRWSFFFFFQNLIWNPHSLRCSLQLNTDTDLFCLHSSFPGPLVFWLFAISWQSACGHLSQKSRILWAFFFLRVCSDTKYIWITGNFLWMLLFLLSPPLFCADSWYSRKEDTT